MPRSVWGRLRNLGRLLTVGLRIGGDCYHLHDPELLPVGAVLRLLGRRVIYDVHEHFAQVVFIRSWVPAWIRRPLSRGVDLIERLVARCLSGVVGVVEEQERRFRGRPFAAVKNYPRLEWFRRVDSEIPEVELIHVGSLSPERGGLLLLDIVNVLRETHPEVRLLSIGKFHSGYIEEEFWRRLGEYGLEKQVRCQVDPVPYEELGALIRKGRIGLIPGQVSAVHLMPFVPTKLFEYLACGLPVVASDLPSIRAFYSVTDWGMLVEPADARAHARAIGYLLDHPEEARVKGARGRDMVEHGFSWDMEAKKLSALYERILQERGDV